MAFSLLLLSQLHVNKKLLIDFSQWGAVGIWIWTILCCAEMYHMLQDVQYPRLLLNTRIIPRHCKNQKNK